MKKYKDKIKMKNGFVYAVMIFISDDNDKVLLLKREDNKKYEPVKGGINEGENEKDAVIREVFEETGLKIDNLSMIKRLEDKLVTSEGTTYIKGVIFKTKLKDKNMNIILSDEHTKFKWVDKKDLKNTALYPPVADKYKTFI